MPASEALKKIVLGMWDEDPEVAGLALPADVQIRGGAKLMAGIKYFARHGVPDNASCKINDLRDGIWEFKEGQKRVSFYDTDGRGGYTPKARFRDRDQADYPDSPEWEVPGFSHDLRLGHSFGKPLDQRKTEEEDIQLTLVVREEDLAHDRTSS